MSKLIQLPVDLEYRRQYGVYSDFVSPPPKQAWTYITSDLDAGVDLSATAVFAPGQAIFVHDVQIMPQSNSTGIADGDTSVWAVTDGTNTLVSKTYNTTNTFPTAETVESLGSIAYGSIASSGRLELSITNGTNANTPVVAVTVLYSPQNAYPEPGWEVVASDDGTATISDAAGGIVTLTPSDGTAGDNDEIYLASSSELFKFLNDKPIIAEAAIQFSEANTDDANIAFGLADAVAANTIVDDGAGMKASFDGACIYKVDGGTKWKCVSSKATTQTITTSSTTAGGSSYQVLRIEVRPVSSSIAEVTYFVDGSILRDETYNKPIKHTIDFTSSPTEMQVFVGAKNGGTNAESLLVDRLGAWQLR